MIKLSTIKTNPKNPRIIKDDKFKKLCDSIEKFPRMIELRPIIVDDDNIVLGGNMRLKALQHLGHKEIPESWIKRASDFTEEEKKEFIIKDNVGFGVWDMNSLANEFDAEDVSAWGVDLPIVFDIENQEPKKQLDSAFFINIRCDDESHCQKLYEEFLEKGLDVKIVT